MNAVILMIPLFLIRFGILGMLGKKALKRAAYFAPVKGRERAALVWYQIANIFIILYPLTLKIRWEKPFYPAALTVYAAGTVILLVATIHFARPDQTGMNTAGIYRISRNPMYVGYFFYFLGCVMLTRSLLLLVALVVFQVSAHWMILAEERWCISRFGAEYLHYMGQVRRYL